MKPLEGLLVLDFSIFLAGPLTALRLGDLGARVIKIERPDVGDLCRQLYISNLQLDGAVEDVPPIRRTILRRQKLGCEHRSRGN